MADFKAVYYGTRCLFQHSDPYRPADFLREYRAEGGLIPTEPAMVQLFLRAVPVCINLPTSLFLLAPLAILAWGPAHLLWMMLMACLLILAAILMWDSAASFAPLVSVLMVCLVLANSEVLFSGGNLAAVAVGLCVVGVWCFINARFAWVGILCLAVSLALKPHDAGLVWLYFLLAGGVYRRRALQTLAVTAALCLPAVVWVTQVAPEWPQELRANLSATAALGGLRDPGPNSISNSDPERVIDLQSVVSLFRDDPRVYNSATYLICGALLAVWCFQTLRPSLASPSAWFALAAVVPLSMLVTYHRPYDAKLLLLTVPACAMLWAEGELLGRIALLINLAAIVLTGDIPLAILVNATRNMRVNPLGIFGQIPKIVLMRPIPFVLLAMGIFYLWVYLRRPVSGKVAK
ncbi:MAG: glycosyltransferase family 87 protein [Terracidiphilus sp.]